jgi:hypothetical protein
MLNDLRVIRLFFPLPAIWVLWLSLQAKLNAFFDFSRQIQQTM